ncbi:MAG: hypothetical protein K0U36_05350 [Alphaproteobacteria bacterium]|nr:hypothetical protein [Alphaproteobacteria bacterium]
MEDADGGILEDADGGIVEDADGGMEEDVVGIVSVTSPVKKQGEAMGDSHKVQ